MKRKKLPGPVRLRPLPPAALTELLFGLAFEPAPDALTWAKNTFITVDAQLHNPHHLHLLDAKIGFMWASAGYSKGMRRILGQTEDLRLAGRGNAWVKGRADQQMCTWFPAGVPDFLITLDGHYCQHCSELEFCALVEHELYHIAHLRDEFGAPMFSRDTGEPKLGIRGHDVEEFIGVVERYGPGDADSDVARMVKAASKKPLVSPVSIAKACGTCLIRAA